MSRYREWDLSCKVYVGNLGSNASKHEIESAFSKYGPLRNVWVARNPPGFAFVEFEDPRDAEDAVRGLDGTRLCGTRVRVEMSTGRSRRTSRRLLSPSCSSRYNRSRSRSPRRSRSRSRSRSRRSRSDSRDRRYRSRSRSRSRSNDRSSEKMAPQKPPREQVAVASDPIKVFCRIRPLVDAGEASCVLVQSETKVVLVPPESSRNGPSRGMQYTFQQVFDEQADQKTLFECVTQPLLDKFFEGNNSLLATYGVTNSGKSFTMLGDGKEEGMMPQMLKSLFNILRGVQAPRYLLRPDHTNGFEVQLEEEAMRERKRMLCRADVVGTMVGEIGEVGESQPSASHLDTNYAYSVFVTHVEVYNNCVYDLLEDVKIPQTKVLREDSRHIMYVHGVNEVEVKSAEEAMEVWGKGKKRRRVANTLLNAESSRSHSIFTLRLAKAPLVTNCSEEIVLDGSGLSVTQMSLVDLAGSERTNRTNNTGERLRETGNINNSLMSFRYCLEVLRENQAQGGNKLVPYRDSKLTHYLKNYFDGQAKVHMVVCINPSVQDYDENIQVLRFAEMTQEVQIQRPTPKVEKSAKSAQKRPYQHAMETVKAAEDEGTCEDIPVDFPEYGMGVAFPSFEINDPQNSHKLMDIEKFLERRLATRSYLVKQQNERRKQFRERLVKMQEENILLKEEKKSFVTGADRDREMIQSLEKRLAAKEAAFFDLKEKTEHRIHTLEKELMEKKRTLTQTQQEAEKKEEKVRQMMELEKEKMENTMQQQLLEQRKTLENKMKTNNKKLTAVKKIVNLKGHAVPLVSLRRASSDSELSQDPSESNTGESNSLQLLSGRSDTPQCLPSAVSASERTDTLAKSSGLLHLDLKSQASSCKTNTKVEVLYKTQAVANPRYARTGSPYEVWLDHRPAMPVTLGTLLQPQMKKRKSITKLLDVSDVVNTKTSRYCLTTQEQDSAGELETTLYKGVVIPSCGGGAQVVFNDLEVLKQMPPTSPGVKRRAEADSTNLDVSEEKRCRQ